MRYESPNPSLERTSAGLARETLKVIVASRAKPLSVRSAQTLLPDRGLRGRRVMRTDSERPVEYARRLYDDVRDWYNNADSKAQVVLAIDGAFLAFLTGAIFAKPSDLKAVVGMFSTWTWSLLALMTLCLMASVISAICCLWSRTYSAEELAGAVEAAQHPEGDSAQYAPKEMWFPRWSPALRRGDSVPPWKQSMALSRLRRWPRKFRFSRRTCERSIVP